MARIIKLPTFQDPRGALTVVERVLPFQVRRVFFIYEVIGLRGGHAHKVTQMALICVSGSMQVYCKAPKGPEQTFHLERPDQCLLLEPSDWHTMDRFSENATLVVLASTDFDKDDYVLEKPL